MPYVTRKQGSKTCVYKKGTGGKPGKKVGCTNGPVNKYLAALHANESHNIFDKLYDDIINEISVGDFDKVAHPSPQPKKWLSPLPVACQICHQPFGEYFIDGSTKMGWGLMCEACHAKYGYGLGTGKGQKYNTKTKIKVEG